MEFEGQPGGYNWIGAKDSTLLDTPGCEFLLVAAGTRTHARGWRAHKLTRHDACHLPKAQEVRKVGCGGVQEQGEGGEHEGRGVGGQWKSARVQVRSWRGVGGRSDQ